MIRQAESSPATRREPPHAPGAPRIEENPRFRTFLCAALFVLSMAWLVHTIGALDFEAAPGIDLAGQALSVPISGEWRSLAASEGGSEVAVPPWDEAEPAPLIEAPRSMPAAASPPTRDYEVRKGDSFWMIAERMLDGGESWRSIAELNPEIAADQKKLRPGKLIKIPARTPARGAAGASADVAAGDRASAPVIAPANAPAIAPTIAPAIAPAMRRTEDRSALAGKEVNTQREHIVARGEDLYTIAKRYRPGRGWQWLLDANRDRIADPNRLTPGMRLRVGGK